MLEILLDFERSAGQMSPVILAIPALLMVMPGLLMWLAGMGVRRVFLGVAGAATGAGCGFLFAGENLIAAVVLIVGATVMAVLLERLFIPVLSGLLAVVIVLTVLSRGQIVDGHNATAPQRSRPSAESLPADIVQSAKIIAGYAVALADEAKAVYCSISMQRWVIAALAGAVFLLGGLVLPRLACAWAFSTLGTVLIFAGMILLLSYKGGAPISKMYQRGSYYGAVFAAMAALGTAEQLLLFRKAFKKKPSKQQPTEGEKKADDGKQSWRGK